MPDGADVCLRLWPVVRYAVRVAVEWTDEHMPDFFISYTSADRIWAEGIGYVLEEEGFSVVVQAWDFRPGNNFVLGMEKAATEADRTILVLSPDYLKSQFTPAEWAAAFARDPKGLERKLVPIMVRRCSPPGLLTSIVGIDLSDEDEGAARTLLLDGVNLKRAKPARPPPFPGTAAKRPPKAFPGLSPSCPPSSISAAARSAAYMPNLKRSAIDAEKRRFSRDTFNAIKAHFEVGLRQLAKQDGSIECDFQPNTATEFTAEVFVNGQSRCRCRTWLGGLHSADGISYAEGHSHAGSNSCNEMLSVSDDQGQLHLSSLMGGFGTVERLFDLKRLSQEQAADYLWRRFLLPLER